MRNYKIISLLFFVSGILFFLLSCSEELPEYPYSFSYDGKAFAEFIHTWDTETSIEQHDNGDVTSTTVFTDPVTPLKVTVKTTTFSGYNAYERVMIFENTGGVNTEIIQSPYPLDMLILNQVKGSPFILHYINRQSGYNRGYRPVEKKLFSEDRVSFGSRTGLPSDTVPPFFRIDFGGASTVFAVGWTGSWRADIKVAGNDSLNVAAGMHEAEFVLYPGEKVHMPSILALTAPGRSYEVNNSFRQLLAQRYAAESDYAATKLPAVYSLTAGDSDTVNAGVALTDSLGAGKAVVFNPVKAVMDSIGGKNVEDTAWLLGESGNSGAPILNYTDSSLREYLANSAVAAAESVSLCLTYTTNVAPATVWRSIDSYNRVGMAEIMNAGGLTSFWQQLSDSRKAPPLCLDAAGNMTTIDMIPYFRGLTVFVAGQEKPYAEMQADYFALSRYLPSSMLMAAIDSADSTSDVHFESFMPFTILVNETDISADSVMAANIKKAASVLEKISQRYMMNGDWLPLTEWNDDSDKWLGMQFHRKDDDAGMIVLYRRAECDGSSHMEVTLSPQTIVAGASYTVHDVIAEKPLGSVAATDLIHGFKIEVPSAPGTAIVTYERE